MPDPTLNGLSDADLWEHLVQSGKSKAEATATVLHRQRTGKLFVDPTPDDTETMGDKIAGGISAAYQGLTMGAGNKITAAARTVLPQALGGVKGFDFPTALKEQTDVLDDFRHRHPVAATATEIAGGLPTVFASGGASALGRAEQGAGALAKLARVAKVAGQGAAYGGVSGALSSNRLGDIPENALHGAEVGAVVAPVAGAVVGGTARQAANLLRRVAPNSAMTARFASAVGAAPITADDQADAAIAGALRKGGVDPETVAIPKDSPTSVMELGSRNVPALVRQARNVPGSNAAQATDRFLNERAARAGQRIESDLVNATGGSVSDVEEPIDRLIQQRSQRARPLYQQAEDYGNIQNPETIAQINSLRQHPDFSHAWERGQRLDALERGQTRVTDPSLAIRDGAGRLRPDLSKVSDDALNAEYSRLAELNSREEAFHSGVEDAGYRTDYEELPRTEKFGRKGQEDLPDADGMVDAERLAADNKIVTDFRRSKMVRAARERAMSRIERELESRPLPEEGVSSDRLAELDAQGLTQYLPASLQPNKDGVTVAQINAWKKGLDAMIESRAGSSNALSRAEAKVYRDKLNGILDLVDQEVPAFKQARADFRGMSELKDAAELGAQHFDPGTSAQYLQRQFAIMSPGEQAAYRANALNAVVAKVRKLGANEDLPEAMRKVNIPQRLFGTQDAGDRLKMLFPDAPSYDAFLTKLEQESLYPKTGQMLQSQSTTAAQQAELHSDPALWRDVGLAGVGSMSAKGRLANRAWDAITGHGSKMLPAVADAIGSRATMTGDALEQLLRTIGDQERNRLTAQARLNGLLRTSTAGYLPDR